jgi:CRP/FNR family transcriptional regulator
MDFSQKFRFSSAGSLFFQRVMGQPVFTVIVTARVKMFKLSVGGEKQILHNFGPGEPIGEVAVKRNQNLFQRK